MIPTLHPHQQTQNRTSQVSRTMLCTVLLYSLPQKPDTTTSDRSELVSEEEKVEQDDLNTHEVMATLTQLLTHMERNNINPTVDEVVFFTCVTFIVFYLIRAPSQLKYRRG